MAKDILQQVAERYLDVFYALYVINKIRKRR